MGIFTSHTTTEITYEKLDRDYITLKLVTYEEDGGFKVGEDYVREINIELGETITI